jgi:hypothetical protein
VQEALRQNPERGYRSVYNQAKLFQEFMLHRAHAGNGVHVRTNVFIAAFKAG